MCANYGGAGSSGDQTDEGSSEDHGGAGGHRGRSGGTETQNTERLAMVIMRLARCLWLISVVMLGETENLGATSMVALWKIGNSRTIFVAELRLTRGSDLCGRDDVV